MKRKFTHAIGVNLATLPLLLSACATADLEPAPDAHSVRWLEDAARAQVDGVRMVTQAATWEGPYPIDTRVTPLRVTIHNGSERPLRIRYGEFALVSPNGEIHSALPLFKIQGSIEEPVTVRATPPPLGSPLFVSDLFYFAPYYDGIYPDITIDREFTYDPDYYATYYTYWRDVDLPTPEMRQQAVPEGVLEPGGHLVGHLYFEKVDVAVPRVIFRADLVNASTGRQFGEIRIPFEVN